MSPAGSPLRGGVRRQPRTPRSSPSRCAAD
uniref:Uncharacterized protein n=1 Tax=Triticum urartu TaxID=4572 RepID=A0A8R7PJN4_TRIUA